MKYDNLVEDQVVIAYLSKGAISLSDSDELSPYDRKLVFNALNKIKEIENSEAIDEN